MLRPSRNLERNKPRPRYGTAATELAIVLPLLLTLTLACCDFGRIVCVHQVVANAARTGAETGATHQYTEYTQEAWEEEIHQAVVNEMSSLPAFDESKMDYKMVIIVDSDDISQIAIDVTYPFRTVVQWPLLPTEVAVHQHVEFRQFR